MLWAELFFWISIELSYDPHVIYELFLSAGLHTFFYVLIIPLMDLNSDGPQYGLWIFFSGPN
jgi:hypothetical protein